MLACGPTHSQREAIAKEGPLHHEELFHLWEAVIQGEASSRERKFVQRLRDTADEELVAPVEKPKLPRTASSFAESPRQSGAPRQLENFVAHSGAGRCRRGVVR